MSPDTGYLEDMLREARFAVLFVEGMSEADFASDEKTQRAVIRCLEVIGEAANRISDETRRRVSDIPWTDVIKQRHLAIHHYRKLELSRIWMTVTHDLPSLIAAIDAYSRDLD